ncbi:MAG: ATP-binding cassette domain-containing protein [Arcobacteraceae bacterium]|nr:ATP-binding cassette domain-containing protein [Arcobacteraceae bacterium]
MLELIRRLLINKKISILILISSFFINLFAIAMPVFVILLINKYVSSGLDGTLYTLTIGILIVLVIEVFMKKVRDQLSSLISPIEDKKLSLKVFQAMTNSKTSAFELLSTSLKGEMIKGLEKIKTAYGYKNINIFVDIPFALLFLLVIYMLSPMVSLIVTFFILVISFFIFIGMISGSQNKALFLSANSSKTAIASSALNASDTIRINNGSKYINELWEKQLEGIEKLKKKVDNKYVNIMVFSQFLTALVGIFVYFIGTQEVVVGTLNIGSLIGLSILSSKAVAPFIQAVHISEQINDANTSLKQINNFLSIPVESTTGTALSEYNGTIEFKNVSFSYPGATTPIFENMNFKLVEGNTLMIYGPNGSGKSTFSKLLAGLFEPTKGNIHIDGVDLRQIAPYWYRTQLMYLPQEPAFVPGTILDNIKLSNEELKDDKLNQIIKDSNLKDFLDKSQKGILTQIVENGKNLSMGIKHRIALAMSLVNDGKLVIFDEPTETLDMDGKHAVYTLINKFKEKKKTIILFTHDKYLLGMADYYIDLSNSTTPRVISKEQWIQHYKNNINKQNKKSNNESK